MTDVFIISGTSWTVAADYNNASNFWETIGAGASAGATKSTTTGTVTGGGAGAWNKQPNISLSGSASLQVGVGGAAIVQSATGATAGHDGTDTFFNGASLGESSVGSKAGLAGAAVTTVTAENGGAGGVGASGVGSSHNDGGRGGNVVTPTNSCATGGGGAAGPNGAGNHGVDLTSQSFKSSAGGSGDAGSGGSAGTTSAGVSGGPGGNGAEMDASHGSGGGGGAVWTSGTGVTGGNGGNFGGGGGSAYTSGTTTSGAGIQGIIHGNYTPAVGTIPVSNAQDQASNLAAWQPADLAQQRRSLLNPSITAVQVDAPPPSHPGRSAAIAATLLTLWQPPDPAAPPKGPISAQLLAPEVDDPPLVGGRAYVQQVPWLWQPADPVAPPKGPLNPQLTAVEVDQPPPSHPARTAAQIDVVLGLWRPVDVAQQRVPADAAISFVAPAGTNPPFTHPGRLPWVASVLQSWQPPDPQPTQKGPLNPQLTAVRVDNPPSFAGRSNAEQQLSSLWPPDPPAQQRRVQFPQGGAPVVVVQPPFGTARISLTAATLAAWQPDLSPVQPRRMESPALASTAIKAGSRFARLDKKIVKIPFTQDKIGSTIYIKVQGYNAYGGGLQSLGNVAAYPYTITGAALSSPLPNVTNLRAVYESGFLKVWWDEVKDFRTGILYELRQGTTWAGGLRIQDYAHPPYLPHGNGTLWVAAKCQPQPGLVVYSSAPQEIIITGNQLGQNLLVTRDEQAQGWLGTLSSGLTTQGINPTASLIAVAGVAQCYYTIPASEIVDIGYPGQLIVNSTWIGTGSPVGQNFLTIADLLGTPDILGASSAQFVDVHPEMQIDAGGGAGFGAWQKFVPGVYPGRALNLRMALSSADPNTVPVCLAWSWTASVAARIDHYQGQSVPAGGLAITFQPDGASSPAAFRGGVGGTPGSPGVPIVSVNWAPSASGEYPLVTGLTLSGCTVTIYNAANTAVSRTGVLIEAEGY